MTTFQELITERDAKLAKQNADMDLLEKTSGEFMWYMLHQAQANWLHDHQPYYEGEKSEPAQWLGMNFWIHLINGETLDFHAQHAMTTLTLAQYRVFMQSVFGGHNAGQVKLYGRRMAWYFTMRHDGWIELAAIYA